MPYLGKKNNATSIQNSRRPFNWLKLLIRTKRNPHINSAFQTERIFGVPKFPFRRNWPTRDWTITLFQNSKSIPNVQFHPKLLFHKSPRGGNIFPSILRALEYSFKQLSDFGKHLNLECYFFLLVLLFRKNQTEKKPADISMLKMYSVQQCVGLYLCT